MRSETLDELKRLADEVLRVNRLSGSEGNATAKRIIKKWLKHRGISYSEEFFYVERLMPIEASIEVGNTVVLGVPYAGSPSGVYEGYVKREPIEGDIALLRVSEEKRDHVKKAKACITYLDKVNTYYYGSVNGEGIPFVNIKLEDVQHIEDAYVKLTIKTKKEKVLCSNIVFDLGRGPTIYLVAHVDTAPEVFGSTDGVGFLLLLFLADELKKNFYLPYRIRFLLTDAKELGLEGSNFHVSKGIKYAYYCINLDTIGWRNPAVIYKDAEGYNGERIMEMFFKHLQDMRMDIPFVSKSSAKSDHIPFKRKGVQTLFLSSEPFTINHTLHDNTEAINWDMVIVWYELILSFLRRFHRL
ncbi:M28 family peptidase [Hydrogenobacter hydrogenophilus]|uniref:Peptidase family M28 n=1 Tax=Hydrogenobacter hydrogenophilus TaxID=35835 RepID=A0A285NWP6_9AQUI|nr:M28 family peptidase [Hydrogenobacter hydrogenophilus]SNZ13895.1 Peptidase family M28 [Hydrogenobacter hydrogenophilus]